jgi:hypothetical protein
MKKLSILLLVICVFCLAANAQISCSNCTYSISDLSKDNYTLTTGQTLCITSTGIIQGTITLNGGTICNDGVFSPTSFTYTQGSFNNGGVIIYTGTIDLNATGIVVDNNSSGTINVTGGITISNANVQFTNNGTLNTTQDIAVTAGTIINNGTLNYNAISNNGGTYTNNGTANCCGN